jgi:predicted PurR-regulated permease PerM
MGRELPVAVRIAFYAWLLVGLALADLLTDGALVTLAVLAGFLFIVLPLCVRFLGRHGEPRAKASGRTVVGFAAFLTVLTAVEVALIPDFGLGTTFWIVAILIPSLEFLGYLSRRESRMSAERKPTE